MIDRWKNNWEAKKKKKLEKAYLLGIYEIVWDKEKEKFGSLNRNLVAGIEKVILHQHCELRIGFFMMLWQKQEKH